MSLKIALIVGAGGLAGQEVFHTSKSNDSFSFHAIQSTVRKKMADVHFTTIPCEPN